MMPAPGTRTAADHGAAPYGENQIFLLDVNVLLALLDPLHSHHGQAHDWFAGHGQAWASCAITLNGALRIMAHPGYSNPLATVAQAADLLADLCRHPGHRFWPGDLNLLTSARVDRSRLATPNQITDTWLLALAVHHGGHLATFDRRLATNAIDGGAQALHVIGGRD